MDELITCWNNNINILNTFFVDVLLSTVIKYKNLTIFISVIFSIMILISVVRIYWATVGMLSLNKFYLLKCAKKENTNLWKGVVVAVIVWLLDFWLPMQSMPITNWCSEFKSLSGRAVQHYVIKWVVQVGGFLRVLRFPSPIKLTATI